MFIYLEMPKFNKKVNELKTRFDKWLFILKNLHKLDRIPNDLRENIFKKLFETAEISKFNKEEYKAYEDSLKYYRDIKNSIDYAKEAGKVEVAKKMLNDNMSIELIIKYTGLSKEEINNLKVE